MSKKMIVANWKMNKTLVESIEFINAFVSKLDKLSCEVVICPPFLSIGSIIELCRKYNVKTGAQNCYFQNSGAFTGEISAQMLANTGVEYVILGHSERRTYFLETDKLVNKKVKSVLNNNMKPIICIGESKQERDAGEESSVILRQLKNALEGVDIDNCKNIVIAYEPVWTIGSNQTVKPQEACRISKIIRDCLSSKYNLDVAKNVPILYGGSINENNVEDFLSFSDIDGVLIGGASLKVNTFSKIVDIANNM